MSVKNDGSFGRLVAAGGPEDLKKEGKNPSPKEAPSAKSKPVTASEARARADNANKKQAQPTGSKKTGGQTQSRPAPETKPAQVARPPMPTYIPKPQPYYPKDKQIYAVRDSSGKVLFSSNTKGECKIYRDYHSQSLIESNMILQEGSPTTVLDRAEQVLFTGSLKDAQNFVKENKMTRNYKNLRVSKGKDHPLLIS